MSRFKSSCKEATTKLSIFFSIDNIKLHLQQLFEFLREECRFPALLPLPPVCPLSPCEGIDEPDALLEVRV